jgi:hypothetical protein
MFREELTYLLCIPLLSKGLPSSVARYSDVVQLAVDSCSVLSVVSVVKWRHHGLLRKTFMAGLRRPLHLDTNRLVRYYFILRSDKSELGLRQCRLMTYSLFRNKSKQNLVLT